MRFSKDFLNITAADFIARSAYQTGKTPLLPIFAAMLGASGAFLGFIVSVSTFTGLVLKPLFGMLSDRWGRRLWLLIGTAFFVVMPFLYRFIDTPQQLLITRIIHGLATAIYGPVTLAYIAELKPKNIAESVGWFGLARSGGYIAGPALAGWLLLWIEPATVFTIIGFISALALVPVWNLKDIEIQTQTRQKHEPLLKQMRAAVLVASRTPGIWLSGTLEAVTFIALYTTKAFLPIFALEAGVNIVLVGLFFSIQEAAHILVKPFGGKIADRIGYLSSIIGGMTLLGIGLVLIPNFEGIGLLIPAVLTGVAQAFIFPSTIALVSDQIQRENLGAGMGFIGTMQNLGKVVGPIMGGFLIQRLGFEPVLYLLAIFLLLGAGLLPVVVGKFYANRLSLRT